jgi:hypothetical protein
MLDIVILENLPEKARPVGQRLSAEILGERLPKVSKRAARANVHPGANAGTRQQDRYVLA